MVAFMERSYPLKLNSRNIRICYAVKLKVQGREMLKLLLHKLEDYKIFYLTESKK